MQRKIKTPAILLAVVMMLSLVSMATTAQASDMEFAATTLVYSGAADMAKMTGDPATWPGADWPGWQGTIPKDGAGRLCRAGAPTVNFSGGKLNISNRTDPWEAIDILVGGLNGSFRLEVTVSAAKALDFWIEFADPDKNGHFGEYLASGNGSKVSLVARFDITDGKGGHDLSQNRFRINATTGEAYSIESIMLYRIEPSAAGADAIGWVKDKDGSWTYYSSKGVMAKSTWVSFGDSWYYLKASGIMANDEFLTLGNVRYYFKPDGSMATGWLKLGSAWYCFKSNGTMITDSWLKYGDNWYYFHPNGTMAANQEIQWNGKLYFLKSDGAMATGWQKMPWGTWKYFNSDGSAMIKSWFKFNDAWYYLGDYGDMYSNIYVDIDGKDYYFRPDGRLAQGWVGHTWTDSQGQTQTWWQYYNADGSLASKQWIKEGDSWYYISEWGSMINWGSYEINGVRYFFHPNGKMASDGWAKETYTWNNQTYTYWYYARPNGTLVTDGWVNDNGSWYYFWSGGHMATNSFIGDWSDGGKVYYLKQSGQMATGWFSHTWYDYYSGQSGTDWYYARPDGTLVRDDWVQSGGKWYYFWSGGHMATNTTIDYKGKTYEFGPDGACKNP